MNIQIKFRKKRKLKSFKANDTIFMDESEESINQLIDSLGKNSVDELRKNVPLQSLYDAKSGTWMSIKDKNGRYWSVPRKNFYKIGYYK